MFNVTGEGKISIPEGIIVDVPRMTHDGLPVMCGDYRAGDESAIAEHIVGGGILRVVNNEPVVVSSSFTWVGGNEDTAITSPANWQGGIAPTFDGTEHLIFSSGTKAVVSGAIKAYSIKVAMPSDFRIEAANENAKIVLGQGGLSLNNENDAPMATCEVACPIELDYLPQTWVVVSNTVLKNLSPISGRPSQNGLVIDSRGRVEFHADNSELYTPLEIRITNRKVSQPRVYNYKGLGSKTRPATIYGAPFIFVIPGNGHYTNEVPLRIFNQCTTPDPNNVYNGIFINDSNQGHLYLKGKVTYYNAYCETYFKGNVHFLGGVTHESGKRIVWRMAGANEWIEGEGFHSEGELEIDYPGNLNISAPCT